MSSLGVAEKRRQFHELHRGGCFVIPNPWDIGSARFLQSLCLLIENPSPWLMS